METAMKTLLITIVAAFLMVGITTGRAAWGDSDVPDTYDMQAGAPLFTPDELRDLLAPIALYPDPLIAQILPAATFIDQIDEAARYVRQYGAAARIDDQPWDVSVKAVAHYPEVLYMMDQKYDWTVSLGQAFVNQGQEVMEAIQGLREEAQAVGNLATTPQQQVVVDDGLISIVPASPDVIYVPQYDPLVVYVERPYPSYGFVTFGTGFIIGVWLNRDCDWHGHRVFYHGWRGGGWIGRARPHVHDRNHIYINARYRTTTVNRRVMLHDTRRFRQDIRRTAQEHRQLPGRPAPRGREQRPQATPPRPVPQTRAPAPQPPQSPRPAAAAPRQPRLPDNRDLSRGREPRGTQGTQAAPFSGYGGYGNRGEAQTYRERGQASRGNISKTPGRPAPTPAPVRIQAPTPARSPAPAPAQHQGVGGGRPSASPPAAHGGGGGGRPQR
jgi:hypothetical protein